jgi:hypothetical protein
MRGTGSPFVIQYMGMERSGQKREKHVSAMGQTSAYLS